jgi:hypothetical protein
MTGKNESTRPIPPRNEKGGVNPSPSTVAGGSRNNSSTPNQHAPKATNSDRQKDDQPPNTRSNPEPARGKDSATATRANPGPPDSMRGKDNAATGRAGMSEPIRTNVSVANNRPNLETARGKDPVGNDKDLSSHAPPASSATSSANGNPDNRQQGAPSRPNKRGREEDNRNQAQPNSTPLPANAQNNPDKGRPAKPIPPPRNGPQANR